MHDHAAAPIRRHRPRSPSRRSPDAGRRTTATRTPRPRASTATWWASERLRRRRHLPGDGAGSIGDAVEVAAGALGDADVAACSVDHQTIQTAVEAYELLNGALPASQQELVDAQLIREPSVRFEISPEGAVVASPGSPCT